MIADAVVPGEVLFRGKSRKFVPLYREICKSLQEGGCEPRPQTIYVVFSLKGEPVAAVYPEGDDGIELALALPQDCANAMTYDATHLKWRKLPIATRVRDENDLKRLIPLLQEALSRVREGRHDVNLDAMTFGKRPRRATKKSDPNGHQT